MSSGGRCSAPTGFAGETIAFDGLAESRTDVLVRIERLSGEVSTARATPASPSFNVPAATGWQQVATAYVWLGVEHILFGIDHLLFVLALILLARSWSAIAAHHHRLHRRPQHHARRGDARLLECARPAGRGGDRAQHRARRSRDREIASRPETPASPPAFPGSSPSRFGLLHGLGFAGALSEVGLPGHAIPVALLFFNIGVELGQLAFTAAVLVSFAMLGAAVGSRSSVRKASAPHAWARAVAAYSIGGVASFWLIERVGGFWA